MAKKGGSPENLKPIRSKEEARIIGAIGGVKSGEARRRKRDAKSAAKLILNLPCTEGMTTNLKAMSVSEEDYTNRVALLARAFSRAMTGDVRAMEFIIEMAGETPKQALDEKKFKIETGKENGSNNAVDDWVNSIPEIESNDDKEDA